MQGLSPYTSALQKNREKDDRLLAVEEKLEEADARDKEKESRILTMEDKLEQAQLKEKEKELKLVDAQDKLTASDATQQKILDRLEASEQREQKVQDVLAVAAAESVTVDHVQDDCEFLSLFFKTWQGCRKYTTNWLALGLLEPILIFCSIRHLFKRVSSILVSL